jgi:hypothetical protein
LSAFRTAFAVSAFRTARITTQFPLSAFRTAFAVRLPDSKNQVCIPLFSPAYFYQD